MFAQANVETQDYSKASQLTDRIERQTAVVDTINVIHAVNTLPLHGPHPD